jgi:hypothetical protein
MGPPLRGWQLLAGTGSLGIGCGDKDLGLGATEDGSYWPGKWVQK